MTKPSASTRRYLAAFCGAIALAGVWSLGCNTIGSEALYYLGGVSPFTQFVGNSDGTGGGATGGDSGFFSGGSGVTDPCLESLNRKIIRLSMRNLAEDHIHYFLILIAFENGETYPNGSACAEDADLYTSFGYERINAGTNRSIGNYCIEGPAFVYFHRAGRFSGGTSSTNSLASAIAPAQGTNATFDSFFTSSGAQVPAPNVILFHNPGTGDGANLSTVRFPNSCADNIVTPILDDCTLDAFYYVDETDQIAGSNALGSGSGRRVPTEIQGTACECGALAGDFPAGAELAPPGVRSADVACNAFMRGGRVEFAFVRNDTTPPFPQLVWRVTDASGGEVHDFDSRAGIR